ncbi:MAG: nitroreductase family protein [Candidatus Bathyarchaeia archaeon]
MDVFETIKGRRSVRKFKSKAVERELTEKLLTAACWAPSGGNIQPWKFIVVEDRTTLEMVRKISPGYFGETPLAILVCADKMRAYKVGGAMGRDYLSIADCAMATENIVLAAYALGLGTCIVKSFSHAAMKEILEIPEGIEPELLVVVGYPDAPPAPPRRIPLKENTYLNKFGQSFQPAGA